MRNDDKVQTTLGEHDKQRPQRPLFTLGHTVATPAALRTLAEAGIQPSSLLQRHQCGDFGELVHEDKASNLEAIQTGGRLLSSYMAGVQRVWVITEAEDDDGVRSSTCLLLPEEY